MVVHTGFAGGGDNLGEVLGGFSALVKAHIQLAFAVGVTVVVVVLVVQLHLHVVGDPVVEADGVSFGRAAEHVAVVQGQELVAGAEFKVSPLLAGFDLGVLATVGVVALAAAEQEVSGLGVPAPELLGSGICGVFLEENVVHYEGTFIAQAFPVTGQLGRPEEVVVIAGEVVGVDVFLAVDGSGVTCAGTVGAVFLDTGLGGTVRCGTADVQGRSLGLEQGTEDHFSGEGITGVVTEVLVVVGHVGPFLRTGHLRAENACGCPEPVFCILHVEADVTGRGEGGADHRALDELQVAGGGVSLDGEVLLEVTCLNLPVLEAGIADDGILEFHQAVCEVHVKLTVPVFIDLAFHGETGTADLYAVADRVGIGGGAEEDGTVGLGADVEPEFILGGGGCHHQDTVLGFDIQDIGLNSHAVLVVLGRGFLRIGRRDGDQGNC